MSESRLLFELQPPTCNQLVPDNSSVLFHTPLDFYSLHPVVSSSKVPDESKLVNISRVVLLYCGVNRRTVRLSNTLMRETAGVSLIPLGRVSLFRRLVMMFFFFF